VRSALLVFFLICAAGGGEPGQHVEQLLGVRGDVLRVRDRELLHADEERRGFFRDPEPFLLAAVRTGLDKPLSISPKAHSTARAALAADSLWAAQHALRGYFPAAGMPTALHTGKLDGLEALKPEVQDAVAMVYEAARRASLAVEGALAKLTEDEREFLREHLPAWLERSKPGDKERAMRGEENVLEREALLRCAALWEKVDAFALRAAWAYLTTAVGAQLPALRRQAHLKQNKISIDTPAGPVVLRGTGQGGGLVDALVLIDFGGDDEHKIGPDAPWRPVRVVIDLAGNDLYLSRQPFSWGGALLGLSLHIDASGDDDYRAGDWGLGCGAGGYGALWDLGGNDRYYGGLGVQGVGIFGAGTLKDDGGDDEYVGGLYCQGFASTGGLGVILDRDGRDSYLAGRDDADIWRRPATYITFAQGAAYGLRFGHILNTPTGRRWKMTGQLPGGIGLLFDGGGDDRYEADVFGQGAGYWYSLAALVDLGGDDRYRTTWYGQGVGTHAAVGCVVDAAGDDWYFSRNTSQGCGHDFSVGILHDMAGNDRYRGTTLCQGAGNALCGVGLLLDEGGDDDYHCVSNSWGFGSKVRKHPDAAPYGLFLDLAGTDRFTGHTPPRADRDGKWKQDERGFGVDVR